METSVHAVGRPYVWFIVHQLHRFIIEGAVENAPCFIANRLSIFGCVVSRSLTALNLDLRPGPFQLYILQSEFFLVCKLRSNNLTCLGKGPTAVLYQTIEKADSLEIDDIRAERSIDHCELM